MLGCQTEHYLGRNWQMGSRLALHLGWQKEWQKEWQMGWQREWNLVC
jgi:hypothetical protein